MLAIALNYLPSLGQNFSLVLKEGEQGASQYAHLQQVAILTLDCKLPCREYAQAQRMLPVASKSTLSCQMQGCRALAPGELNPRRFTRRQPSG
jgi:hypothetical protein